MRLTLINFAAVIVTSVVVAHAQEAPAPTTVPAAAPLTQEAINSARLDTIAAQMPLLTVEEAAGAPPRRPDPAIVRLQILLDQAGEVLHHGRHRVGLDRVAEVDADRQRGPQLLDPGVEQTAVVGEEWRAADPP